MFFVFKILFMSFKGGGYFLMIRSKMGITQFIFFEQFFFLSELFGFLEFYIFYRVERVSFKNLNYFWLKILVIWSIYKWQFG